MRGSQSGDTEGDSTFGSQIPDDDEEAKTYLRAKRKVDVLHRAKKFEKSIKR